VLLLLLLLLGGGPLLITLTKVKGSVGDVGAAAA
jgi:hypothetical protein